MISNKLRQLRENKNKDQQYVAEILNIARNTYNEYETGKTMPSIKSLCILANLYNVSLDYLLDLNKSKNPYGKMKEYNNLILKRNIKIIREKLNYTQEQLANIISCHRVTIARYENGQINIQLDYLIKLSKISKIPTDYIVGIISN